jgi:hypothetical protein
LKRLRTSEDRLQTKITKHFGTSPKESLHLILYETIWIIDSGCSFRVTELLSFQKWMAELKQPSISRSLLSRDIIPLLYRAVRLSIFQHLQVPDFKAKTLDVNCASFSITFDCWSDVGHKNSFVAVTRHWYSNNSWDLQSGTIFLCLQHFSHACK